MTPIMDQENNKNIIYEHPMNERIRNLLRIEHLYENIENCLKEDSEQNCRTILEVLLHISELLVRSDMKNEIIKELKRHLDVFNVLKSNDEYGNYVDIDRLNVLNNKIDEQLKNLQDLSYDPGKALRDNELVKIFNQRINIPGGTCNFDLPRLHYWLEEPEFKRKQDLIDWSLDLVPIKESTNILLNNIRKSSTPTHENAESGFYHKQIGGNTPCQLIRVIMNSSSPYYPDISGVKHRFTVRFMEGQNSNIRATQIDNDVHFELHCCIL